MKNIAAIVLAAGAGTRMKSKTSKVVHEIHGKPMIVRTLLNMRAAGVSNIIIVASPQNHQKLKKILPKNVKIAIQKEPRGTADAAKVGLRLIEPAIDTVVVINGDDSAFYIPETIKRVINQHINKNSVQTFLSVKVLHPTGLGRVIEKNGKVLKVVEEKEATNKQKKIQKICAGLYVFDHAWLGKNISKVKKSRLTEEKYLVDLIEIAIKDKKRVNTYLLKDSSQWHSVNTQEDLKLAHDKFKRVIHVMGAAGAGASAVAGIAKAYGYQVSGCDINPKSSYTAKLNIKIEKGHKVSHAHNAGMLIISPAIIKKDPKNEEIKEARKQNIPVMTWQEFQGKHLHKNKFVVAVAGGYGKSTTTAMISQILIDAKLDPTCEVGATVHSWGKNFIAGKSKYYVTEADEYADNFLNYKSDIAIILNIAWDHPDYFKNKKSLENSYKKFISNIKKDGCLVIGEDSNLDELTKIARPDINRIKIKDFHISKLRIIGNYRKTNANAALTVAQILNINIKNAKKSAQRFTGLGRRLEYKGKVNNCKIYDDYAVQPFTIQTTVDALKEKYAGKNLVMVFEPHTFSRIDVFFKEFIDSLKTCNADAILVTDVFAAREKGNKSEVSQKLARRIGPKATYTGSIKESANHLKDKINNFDIILSVGAGDVYKIYDYLKK